MAKGPICPECKKGGFKITPIQQDADTVLIVYCGGCGHIVGCVYRPISEVERQRMESLMR